MASWLRHLTTRTFDKSLQPCEVNGWKPPRTTLCNFVDILWALPVGGQSNINCTWLARGKLQCLIELRGSGVKQREEESSRKSLLSNWKVALEALLFWWKRHDQTPARVIVVVNYRAERFWVVTTLKLSIATFYYYYLFVYESYYFGFPRYETKTVTSATCSHCEKHSLCLIIPRNVQNLHI